MARKNFKFFKFLNLFLLLPAESWELDEFETWKNILRFVTPALKFLSLAK